MADFDGNQRGMQALDPADATGESIFGPVIDVGAFEVQPGPEPDACPADLNGDGTVDGADPGMLLGSC
jgi:hypothetical protein